VHQPVFPQGPSKAKDILPRSASAEGSQLSMGIPWTHRRWRRVPEKRGWHVLTHDPMPKGSATPRIALMNNNREAERALRVYRVLWQWERLLASKRSQSLRAVSA
jgi:hypothetical protein